MLRAFDRHQNRIRTKIIDRVRPGFEESKICGRPDRGRKNPENFYNVVQPTLYYIVIPSILLFVSFLLFCFHIFFVKPI